MCLSASPRSTRPTDRRCRRCFLGGGQLALTLTPSPLCPILTLDAFPILTLTHKLTQVLARRRPQPPVRHSIALPPRVLPRDKHQHLAHKAHREIVSEIRPTPAHDLLLQLKKETMQASVRATRSPFVPPSNARSVFVQLRRAAMEREASGNPYSAKGAFLWPTEPADHAVDRRGTRPPTAAPTAAQTADHRESRPTGSSPADPGGGGWSVF